MQEVIYHVQSNSPVVFASDFVSDAQATARNSGFSRSFFGVVSTINHTFSDGSLKVVQHASRALTTVSQIVK